ESDQHDLAGLAARSGACVRILQRPTKRRAEQLNRVLDIASDDGLVCLAERSRVTAGRQRDEGDECEDSDIVHDRAPALRYATLEGLWLTHRELADAAAPSNAPPHRC